MMCMYIDRAVPEERDRLFKDLRSGTYQSQKRREFNHVKTVSISILFLSYFDFTFLYIHQVLHVLVQLMFRKYTRPISVSDIERLNRNLKDYKDEIVCEIPSYERGRRKRKDLCLCSYRKATPHRRRLMDK